ncbi:MAG TPA: hypothetical protein VGK67_06575 [Myxococcales bacterium]|jgi:hypothetical protein
MAAARPAVGLAARAAGPTSQSEPIPAGSGAPAAGAARAEQTHAGTLTAGDCGARAAPPARR